MGCCDFLELILNSIYLAICLTSFIWRLTKSNKGAIFIEFEMWGIMAQIVYYTLFLIIGFTSVFNKEKEKEKESENPCQNFLKNIIFKYLFPFVMNSAVVFYLGYFLKWFYLDVDNINNDFFLSIFEHGLSQAGFLIDLILFKRDYKDTHFFDFLVISAMYIGYCIFLFSIKPTINTYNFLANDIVKDNNSFIASLMITCYFIYLYMYFLYMYIVKFKSGVRNLFWGEKKDKKKDEKDEKEKKSKEEKEKPLMDESEEKTVN